jgi:hypothetical protein
MKKLPLLLISIFFFSSPSVYAGSLKDLQINKKLYLEYNSGNLIEAERLLNELEDPVLNQLWTSKLILKALDMKKCKIGKSLISQLEDLNMQALAAARYKMSC